MASTKNSGNSKPEASSKYKIDTRPAAATISHLFWCILSNHISNTKSPIVYTFIRSYESVYYPVLSCLDLRGIIFENGGMTRNIIKFATGGIIIAVLGAGVLFGIDYFRYRTSPDYKRTYRTLMQRVFKVDNQLHKFTYILDSLGESNQ